MTGHARSLPLVAAEHPRGRSPFGRLAPSIGAAVVFAVVALLQLAFGGVLPGGRWLAVHLFTLGVLTNLVLTFSEHFSRTLTRTPGERAGWWPLVTNAGIVVVLVGRVAEHRLLLAAGTVVLVVVVLLAYWRVRGMRRRAVGARFTWVVRAYERAHGAFVHGAALGALLGTGVLVGRWHGAGRIAHLHVNLLGWGGLTLLATLVFFGPTLARARIQPGADARAARALRHGATGLTVGTLLLLATGLGGVAGSVARLLAAGALAVLAWATTVVCIPVIRAAHGATGTAARLPLIGLGAWFVAVVWLDVLVVATGTWRLLDSLGVLMLLGVLGQAIAAVLVYLTPMLRGRSAAARNRSIERLERGGRTRAVLYNLAVAALASSVVVDAQLGDLRAWLVGAGSGLVAVVILQQLAVAAWPLPKALDEAPAAQP